MSKVSKYFPIVTLTVLLGAPAMRAQSQPPRIFFTDLTSGPNTGGENNNGTILTIYGKRFGATQGTSTVTVGGAPVAAYLQWGANAPGALGIQKISVAIGSAAVTGNVVVTTSAGVSNGAPFTVRSGNIYCVSNAGSDSDIGAFPNHCWLTVVKAKNTITAGDIAYVEDRVAATTIDTTSGSTQAALHTTTAGAPNAPKAIVAYPGATVTLGTMGPNGVNGIDNGGGTYWVFSGLTLLGGNSSALNGFGHDIRAVSSDISCPNASGATSCVGSSSMTNYVLLGNYVHNSGNTCGTGCKLYHAVYFASGTNSVTFAWNDVNPDPALTGVAGCRAVQFFAPTVDEYDLHVHDNFIHNSICDGLNFASVDPVTGPVEAYNNVIWNAGTGPDPSGNGSSYTCMRISANNTHLGNPVDIYNNSTYNCGPIAGGGGASFDLASTSVNINIRLRNNIFQELTGETYISAGSGAKCAELTGINNLWFGVGVPPCSPTFNSDLNVDPQYVNPSTFDFHLQIGSPVINAGVNTGIATDLDGILRPQGTAYAIGAYEFVGGTTVQRPKPPTNLSVVSVK